jgi:hypothetical protein
VQLRENSRWTDYPIRVKDTTLPGVVSPPVRVVVG